MVEMLSDVSDESAYRGEPLRAEMPGQVPAGLGGTAENVRNV